MFDNHLKMNEDYNTHYEKIRSYIESQGQLLRVLAYKRLVLDDTPQIIFENGTGPGFAPGPTPEASPYCAMITALAFMHVSEDGSGTDTDYIEGSIVFSTDESSPFFSWTLDSTLVADSGNGLNYFELSQTSKFPQRSAIMRPGSSMTVALVDAGHPSTALDVFVFGFLMDLGI